MEEVNTVTSISNKDGKYGIKLGEKWFNGFGQAPCRKGDKVKVIYEVNGQFNNVKNLEVIQAGNSKSNLADIRHLVDAGNIVSCAKDLVIAGKFETLSKAAEVCYSEFVELAIKLKGLDF